MAPDLAPSQNLPDSPASHPHPRCEAVPPRLTTWIWSVLPESIGRAKGQRSAEPRLGLYPSRGERPYRLSRVVRWHMSDPIPRGSNSRRSVELVGEGDNDSFGTPVVAEIRNINTVRKLVDLMSGS